MQKKLESEALKVEVKDLQLDKSVANINQIDETKGWAQMFKLDATIDDASIENAIKEEYSNKNEKERFKNAKTLLCLQN